MTMRLRGVPGRTGSVASTAPASGSAPAGSAAAASSAARPSAKQSASARFGPTTPPRGAHPITHARGRFHYAAPRRSRVDASQFEKLGAFYLGREFDPASERVDEAPLLYDAGDLTTHGVIVGMTGSGKTGLA